MSADLVIKGGTVVDGTGGPSVVADVAVSDGRIVAVGPDLSGERTLDATGAVVAPGFIDIHTHYDAQVFWDPALSPSCYHGVTTVVAGNCGFSIAPTRPEGRDVIARTLENVEDMNVASLEAGIPWEFETFPEYLEAVERRGTVLNYAAYIGHTALRLFVMGEAAYERGATPGELAEMQRVLGEAVDAGAAGFATSFAMTHRGVDGKPVPSRFAEPGEFEALLATMGEHRRGVIAIAPGEQCGIEDMYRLQPAVGLPFTYGALLSFPTGAHRRLVDVNREGWAAGAQVWPQVSPRPLAFAMTMAEPFTLNVNTAFAGLMSVGHEERRAAYADPAWRARAVEAFATQTALLPRWDTFEIAESTTEPAAVGRRLSDLAAERGTTPLDTLLDLALGEPGLLLRVRCILANDEPDEVGFLLQQDHCTLGLSDAGAHVGQLCDAAQATDFLGNWVRDRSILPLEDAVRRLTGTQADLFGFDDRGYVRPGLAADLVVFDPDTVGPGPVVRVRDFPAGAERLTAPEPTGVRHVVVNGTPVRVGGEPDADGVGARPGAVVRPSRRA